MESEVSEMAEFGWQFRAAVPGTNGEAYLAAIRERSNVIAEANRKFGICHRDIFRWREVSRETLEDFEVEPGTVIRWGPKKTADR